MDYSSKVKMKKVGKKKMTLCVCGMVHRIKKSWNGRIKREKRIEGIQRVVIGKEADVTP